MRKVVVSVHDVTSRFRNELETIFAALDEAGVRGRSELVVPNYNRQFDVTADAAFIEIVQAEKAKGAEISLHGIHHDYAEFFRFDYDGANAALREGRRMFEDAFGFSPPGFVPPQWQLSRGGLQAVREMDFLYTETLRGIYLRSGVILKTFPLNYDWGLAWVDRLFATYNFLVTRLRCSGVIRFALHPLDVVHGTFETAMSHLRHLLARGWEAVTCQQLCESMAGTGG